jgi:hypothetical protein
MTITPLKQKKIKLLYEAGLSLPEIAKKTRVDYKTAKKYSELSTITQPQSPFTQQSVTDDRSPKSEPPEPKRTGDTTRSYAYYENVPYNRTVRVAPPSFLEPFEEPQQMKPTLEQNSPNLTKTEKLFKIEQLRFSERRGIPCDGIIKRNKEIREKTEKEAEEARKEAKHKEWIKRRKQEMNERHVAFLNLIYDQQKVLYQQREKAEREYWDSYHDSIPKKSKILPVIKEELSNAIKQNNEKNKRIMHGLGEISKNQDEYYISHMKKKQNMKIIQDLLPEGIMLLKSLEALYLADKKRRKTYSESFKSK